MVLVVAGVACAVLYVVMRYPHLRREQFQGGRAFSWPVALGCAATVYAFFVWVAFALQ